MIKVKSMNLKDKIKVFILNLKFFFAWVMVFFLCASLIGWLGNPLFGFSEDTTGLTSILVGIPITLIFTPIILALYGLWRWEKVKSEIQTVLKFNAILGLIFFTLLFGNFDFELPRWEIAPLIVWSPFLLAALLPFRIWYLYRKQHSSI